MSLITIGWREWIDLPELGLEAIKVKVDTGARTSALHAYHIELFNRDGRAWVRFVTQPEQYNPARTVKCEAALKDIRYITNSGGQREERYVIETQLNLGGKQWPIELTLTNRRKMKFRMLLGRHAMRNQLLVDPGKSYMTGRFSERYPAEPNTQTTNTDSQQ